jgi:protein associated with RNAse G/E
MDRRTGNQAAPGVRILLRATKYDGTAHWIQPFTVIKDDGVLIETQYRARTPIYTSRGEFRSPYDSHVYFWRDRWYNVFRLSKPGCELALWYCNITTPPRLDGAQLNYVDLDLDVIVRPGGDIQLVDGEEFQERQRTLNYPKDVICRAEQAACEVSQLARHQRFPFDRG